MEKIHAVEKTNLVESVEDEYEAFKNDPELQKEYQQNKPQLTARKNEIYQKINQEPDYVKAVSSLFTDSELVNTLKNNNNFTIDYLNTNYSVNYEKLEQYYSFSKFKYECGIYDEAEQMLGNYITTAQALANHSLTHYQAAIWGRLACRILQAKWTEAQTDLNLVKESIEVRNIQPLDQLRSRGWLMHWSLFVYFFQRDGIDSFIDLYSERYYLQTIENLCPWLLRYYIVAIILSPHKRSKLLKDILQEIKSLSYLYSDPMTEFLSSIYDSFDFNIATVKLGECAQLMKNDFFLKLHLEKFLLESRILICEMYVIVHHTIDLKMMAENLSLTNEEAEKWMIDMVRGVGINSATASASNDKNAQQGGNQQQQQNATGNSSAAAMNAASMNLVNAKIDSFGKQVIIPPPVATSHQQAIDATKELTTRTSVLSNNLENLVKEQAMYLLQRN
jgi:translation initiation factor 3 subunit E